jgi:hypothetical protein
MKITLAHAQRQAIINEINRRIDDLHATPRDIFVRFENEYYIKRCYQDLKGNYHWKDWEKIIKQ